MLALGAFGFFFLVLFLVAAAPDDGSSDTSGSQTRTMQAGMFHLWNDSTDTLDIGAWTYRANGTFIDGIYQTLSPHSTGFLPRLTCDETMVEIRAGWRLPPDMKSFVQESLPATCPIDDVIVRVTARHAIVIRES